MKHFLTNLFVLLALSASAQKITVNLPYFPGKEYAWIIFNGDKQDTIARGSLDTNGQTVLTVPPAYENWRGMSNCLLAGGGGLEIILNGEENFTVACIVEHPTINDIYYTGSEENTFLLEQYKKQQDLLNKAGIIAAAVQAYTPQDSLYKALLDEKDSLTNRFANLQRQTAESPLYAARIRQMSDFCQGIGSHLNLTEKEMIEEQRQYVRETVDFKQLWNSGLWRPLFSQWISLETGQSDSTLLTTDGKAIIARVKDGGVLADLSKKLITLLHQYGKEDLLAQLLDTEDLLAPGNPAPKLYLPDNTTIVPLNSLVIFYESDCSNCENELAQLRGNYSVLQEKNIRVITISADTDEAVYHKNADTFPWQQKICDYKGFNGVNFRNYAIVGTPTMYAVDGKGTITGRYSRLEDYLK